MMKCIVQPEKIINFMLSHTFFLLFKQFFQGLDLPGCYQAGSTPGYRSLNSFTDKTAVSDCLL